MGGSPEYAEQANGHMSNGHTATVAANKAVVQEKPTFGQRIKNNFRRFWPIHLVLFIVIGVVATIILLYVAFPHIAQGQLQRASLDLISEEVADPQADSVQLTLTTQANNPSPYHPKLDAFNVSLFLEDTLPDIKPFGYITIPSITAAKHVNITVSQRLNIVDMDQFNKYTLTTLQADTYRVALQGKTKLREMKFPATDVQFNKVITTQGLNKLQQLSVSELNLHLLPLPDGTNVDGTITIENPSVQTIFLGNVTSNIYCDGDLLGNTTIPNMQLKPGTNNLPMTATTDQIKVLGKIASKYTTGTLPVQIVGQSAVNNGVRLTYFEQALAQNVISTNLNVAGAIFKFVLNSTDVNQTITSLIPGPANPQKLLTDLGASILNGQGINFELLATDLGVNVTAVNSLLASAFGGDVSLSTVLSDLGGLIMGNQATAAQRKRKS